MPPEPALSGLLRRGLVDLGLAASDRQLAQIDQLLDLLEKWNGVYNLTAIRDRAQMVDLHILDSAAISPYVANVSRSGPVLDVGTGAGFPGLVLAILQPECRFVLLDSNGKKVRFVNQAVAELGLQNVAVVQSRVEDYQPSEPFPLLVSRAFALLSDTVDLTQHLLAIKGYWLLMKGKPSIDELNALQDLNLHTQTHRLVVPGLDADRHLVQISRGL